MNNIFIELPVFWKGSQVGDMRSYIATFHLTRDSNFMIRGQTSDGKSQLAINGVMYHVNIPYKELLEKIKAAFEGVEEE